MAAVIKAEVLRGRYQGQSVRITNVSTNDSGKKMAACFVADGSRANILLDDLKILEDKPETPPTYQGAKTSSPFVSGSTGSRTMTQTKNMEKKRIEIKSKAQICENCGREYNLDDRRGKKGKITWCDECVQNSGSL